MNNLINDIQTLSLWHYRRKSNSLLMTVIFMATSYGEWLVLIMMVHTPSTGSTVPAISRKTIPSPYLIMVMAQAVRRCFALRST